MERRIRIVGQLVVAGAVLLGGCEHSARVQAEQRAQAAETRLKQMDAVAATKDSLVTEMMTTTTFINQMNDELSKVKLTKGKNTVTYQERVIPVADYRAAMLARLDSVITRLNTTQVRLRASEAHLKELTGKDQEMSERLAQFQTMIDQQKEQIIQLTSQVETLQVENTKLASEKAQLTEEKTQLTTQVTQMTDFANRVYYVIGTKKELLAKGVAAQTGGSRFLGIGWKSGEALVPNKDVHEDAFTPLSKPTDIEIALPKADKKYAIVSPQNVKYVETQPAKDGTYKGSIKISNPDAFWAPSKYLIVVEK